MACHCQWQVPCGMSHLPCSPDFGVTAVCPAGIPAPLRHVKSLCFCEVVCQRRLQNACLLHPRLHIIRIFGIANHCDWRTRQAPTASEMQLRPSMPILVTLIPHGRDNGRPAATIASSHIGAPLFLREANHSRKSHTAIHFSDNPKASTCRTWHSKR